MLDHGAKELLHSVNSDMWTPLMVACDVGSLATVQVLVSQCFPGAWTTPEKAKQTRDEPDARIATE